MSWQQTHGILWNSNSISQIPLNQQVDKKHSYNKRPISTKDFLGKFVYILKGINFGHKCKQITIESSALKMQGFLLALALNNQVLRSDLLKHSLRVKDCKKWTTATNRKSSPGKAHQGQGILNTWTVGTERRSSSGLWKVVLCENTPPLETNTYLTSRGLNETSILLYKCYLKWNKLI